MSSVTFVKKFSSGSAVMNATLKEGPITAPTYFLYLDNFELMNAWQQAVP